MKEITIRMSDARLKKLKELCEIEVSDNALIYIALEVYEQTRSNEQISLLMDDNEKLTQKINHQHSHIQRLHRKCTKLTEGNKKGGMR